MSNALLPLNIASNLTKLQLQMQEIQVVEFNLIENGLLLPLHGSPTAMTGSIKAAKVIVNNSVHLQGPIEGTWKRRSIPVMIIPEPINIHDILPLESAKIENLRSQDLIDNKTGSVKETLSKIISLNKNISASLTLFSDKMVRSLFLVYSFFNKLIMRINLIIEMEQYHVTQIPELDYC